jgi:predicted hydrocarbon binding protein
VSQEDQPKSWDSLWNEYGDLLKKWTQTFESLQKTGSEIQAKYNEVMQKALKESSPATLQQFYENWQKSIGDSGQNIFKQFGEDWQKLTNQTGIEQLKAYNEMMNKFAETWKSMWRA